MEYLIEVCGADVEQRGRYEVPDDRTIHTVTPLWCASVAGMFKVNTYFYLFFCLYPVDKEDGTQEIEQRVQ